MKEKILKTRAALLANQEGLMINGKEHAQPSAQFMNKIKKAKRLQETLAAEVGDDDKDLHDPEISSLQHSLKFSQREAKRI